MGNTLARAVGSRRVMIALCVVAISVLLAVPVFAGWLTINTNDTSATAGWPATPLYTSACDDTGVADYLEIRNAWVVNDGTSLYFRIETCDAVGSYDNVRMAAGLDCNNDGDIDDPHMGGPQGDRRAVYWISADQVWVVDGQNSSVVQVPGNDNSERVGPDFEWRLPLRYIYPACRASADKVGIGLGVATTTSGGPVTQDETPLYDWNIRIDYGDAINPDPQSQTCTQYPSRLGCDGARHGLESSLRLGAIADPDGGELHDTNATADDLNNQADEDGVTPTLGVNWTAGGSGSLDLSVTGGNGVVNCWVDWTRDSDWADAGEQVVTEAPVNTGLTTLSVSVPAGATFPNSYTTRCRLAPLAGQANMVTGPTEFGEVEDYVWAFGATGNRPVPVALAVSLAPTANDVQVSWTASPSNEAYLILRSPRPYFQPGDGDVTPITDPDNASPYDDTGVAGNPGAPTSLYYAVQGQVTSSTPDLLSTLSNRVALFEFGLTPGG